MMPDESGSNAGTVRSAQSGVETISVRQGDSAHSGSGFGTSTAEPGQTSSPPQSTKPKARKLGLRNPQTLTGQTSERLRRATTLEHATGIVNTREGRPVSAPASAQAETGFSALATTTLLKYTRTSNLCIAPTRRRRRKQVSLENRERRRRESRSSSELNLRQVLLHQLPNGDGRTPMAAQKAQKE